MTKTAEYNKAFNDLFSPILGQIKVKSYFSSYYGLFCNKVLFALYKDGKLFFKFSPQHLSEIKSFPDTYVLNDPELKLNTEQFYLVPSGIQENMTQYPHWFEYILSKNTEKKRHIRNLLNMNFSLERLLCRNGIRDIGDFYALGCVNIFVRLIQRGEDVSKELLFKMHCAIQHKLVYCLDDEQKKNLLRETDQALYDAGLRKRFVKEYQS